MAAEFYDKGALVQPIVASFCSIRASVVTMRLCIDAGHMMTNVHDVSCANLQHHGKNNYEPGMLVIVFVICTVRFMPKGSCCEK